MTIYFKKPLLIAIACGTMMMGTGCADDSLSKGLPKVLLLAGGVGAGALVGRALSPGNETTGMLAGAGIGGGLAVATLLATGGMKL